MASDWDEAAARKRLADYDAELDAIGEELQGSGEPREFRLFELRARLETWCWHDQRCAFAEIDRLRLRVEKLEAEIFAIS